MNNQEDFGPLEDISAHLKATHYPAQALISIGATAYEEQVQLSRHRGSWIADAEVGGIVDIVPQLPTPGGHGLRHMEMHGRADDHGVDIRFRDHLLVVGVLFGRTQPLTRRAE